MFIDIITIGVAMEVPLSIARPVLDVYLCVDIQAYMFMTMCGDMCIDIHIGMGMDMRIGMCIGMGNDMHSCVCYTRAVV